MLLPLGVLSHGQVVTLAVVVLLTGADLVVLVLPLLLRALRQGVLNLGAPAVGKNVHLRFLVVVVGGDEAALVVGVGHHVGLAALVGVAAGVDAACPGYRLDTDRSITVPSLSKLSDLSLIVASHGPVFSLLNRLCLLVGGVLRLIARLVVLNVCVRIAERIIAAHFLSKQPSKLKRNNPHLP